MKETFAMSKQGKEATAQRFGGEFGPYRKPGTQGVSLSTFKTLVWTSNIGGLVLLVISLELLFVAQQFGWGLLLLVLGVGVAFDRRLKSTGRPCASTCRDVES